MNCDAKTLRTMHAYEAFIEKTMAPIVREYEKLPKGDVFGDPMEVAAVGAENAPRFTATELFCDAILARTAWKTWQHKRHMLVAYGVHD